MTCNRCTLRICPWPAFRTACPVYFPAPIRMLAKNEGVNSYGLASIVTLRSCFSPHNLLFPHRFLPHSPAEYRKPFCTVVFFSKRHAFLHAGGSKVGLNLPGARGGQWRQSPRSASPQEYRPAPPDKAPKSSHRNHTAHTLGIYAIGMPQNHGPWNSASTTLPPLRGFVASCETIQTTFPTGHMTKPLICINAHKKPGAMVNLHVCTRVRHIG